MKKINGEASVWSEFKNPEGRSYYYNSKTTESTWDKPSILNDLIGTKAFDYLHISIFYFKLFFF